MYFPGAEIVHLGGSTMGRPDTILPKRVFVQRFKSNLYYYEKHTSKLNVWAYKVGLVSILLLRILFLALKILLSKPEHKMILLGHREICWAAIRVLLGPGFRKQNVFAEMKFNYLS